MSYLTKNHKTVLVKSGDGGSATRHFPRDMGAEEFRGDPTVGPRPKVWTRGKK